MASVAHFSPRDNETDQSVSLLVSETRAVVKPPPATRTLEENEGHRANLDGDNPCQVARWVVFQEQLAADPAESYAAYVGQAMTTPVERSDRSG
jgi:hypothetical protein